MLDCIQQDEVNDDRARAMCADWGTVCHTAEYTKATVVASNTQRWRTLNTYVDDSLMQSKSL